MGFECIEADELYEKDKKLKTQDVQILLEWLKKQPHLPQLHESQVAVFLHSCYYRIEAAKTTIDNYFTLRTQHPEGFAPLDEDSLRKSFSCVFTGILPKKAPKDCAILLLKLIDFRAENFNFCQSVTVIDMVTTLHMHTKGFERGGIAIFDCKGFTFGHLARFNLSVLKHAVDHVQEGAPVRIKAIHFINVNPVMDKVMTMVKPLIKRELQDSLQLHSSNESLYKYVPMDCLPEDYGGTSPSCQILQEDTLQSLLHNFDFFHWHDGQKVDESRRFGKSKCVYGTEGTFKKMELD